MSLLREVGVGRRGGRRTTVVVDADTVALLAWLRGWQASPRISASRLLRDAAAKAAEAQGKAAIDGEVVSVAERNRRIEAKA